MRTNRTNLLTKAPLPPSKVKRMVLPPKTIRFARQKVWFRTAKRYLLPNALYSVIYASKANALPQRLCGAQESSHIN